MGPGCWDGGKKALEDIAENIVFPTRTRVVKRKDRSKKIYLYITLFLVIVAILMKLWLNCL